MELSADRVQDPTYRFILIYLLPIAESERLIALIREHTSLDGI